MDYFNKMAELVFVTVWVYFKKGFTLYKICYDIDILRYYYNLNIVGVQFKIRPFFIFNHPVILTLL